VLRFLLLPLKLGEAQIVIADPIPTLSGKCAQQTDVCFGSKADIQSVTAAGFVTTSWRRE
jgi:hypothetical protein